jgi:hypothetical protein
MSYGYGYNYRDSYWEADAAARGLVYDPYTGRYVEPWNVNSSYEEAVASSATVGIVAIMEVLFMAVGWLIVLVLLAVVKILDWFDLQQEYRRLHEEKEPLGYQYDASLKRWGSGVRERYVLTGEGLVKVDVCPEPEKSRPREVVYAERCRLVLTPRGLVPAEVVEREEAEKMPGRKAGGAVAAPVRGRWEFDGI